MTLQAGKQYSFAVAGNQYLNSVVLWQLQNGKKWVKSVLASLHQTSTVEQSFTVPADGQYHFEIDVPRNKVESNSGTFYLFVVA